MQYKVLLITIISVFLNSTNTYSNQNNGYKIEVNAPFKKGSMAYLARYWKGDSYISDSTKVSDNGLISFSGSTPLQSGQYLLFIKPDLQIELLIDDEQENIKIDLDKDISKSKISGNNDTKLFWNYINKLNALNAKRDVFLAKIQNEKTSDSERKKAISEYKEVIKSIKNFVQLQAESHNGSWFSTFIRASEQINGPNAVPENQEQFIENKRYMKNHYFDQIDLTDTRLWNTSFFVEKLDSYINEIVSQSIDSIADETSWVVSKTKENDKAFELMLSHMVNTATTSKVMGMENVWAKLAEDYIFEKNISWIDNKQYNDLKAAYSLIENNRMGMKAENLQLLTIDADTINTNQIEANYTVLYFYSTSCAHCDKEMSLLREEFYPKYKDLGFKVIAINLDRNIEYWKMFMEKHDMNIEGWTNLFDSNFKSEYWLKYDTSGTPSLYLLDKNKIIIAKKLDISNLENYLKRIIK